MGPKMFPPKYFGPNDAEATLLVHYPKFGPRASFGTILAQEGPGVMGPKIFPKKYFGPNDAEATPFSPLTEI